jgi:hypothetical protein
VLLDIAPTLAVYEQTQKAFARAYCHWFFLIQSPLLPEALPCGHYIAEEAPEALLAAALPFSRDQ